MGPNNKDSDGYDLSDEERFALRKGKDAAECGEFAPDDEMETFYRCHRDWSDDAFGMEAFRPKP